MEALRHTFRILLTHHTALYAYRWLAWGVAGVAMLLTPSTATLPMLGLFVFAGIINILVTGFASAYRDLVQRRPLLLGLDMLVGVVLVAASGGLLLPFWPYALAALVVPALVLSWRGVLVASLVFVLFDQLAFFLMLNLAEPMPPPHSLLRTLLPIGFALAWWAAAHGIRRLGVAPVLAVPRPMDVLKPPQTGGSLRRGASSLWQRALPSRDSQDERLPGVPAVSPVVAARSANAPFASSASTTTRLDHPPAPSRAAAPVPPPRVDLATALDQLVQAFEREHTIALHMDHCGPTQQLSLAKQMTLVKLAQEALHNVARHSQAHTAVVQLHFQPHRVSVLVQDDGVGLMDGTYERPGLHALRALSYRLAEMDGCLEVSEGEHGGVLVRGSMPLSTG